MKTMRLVLFSILLILHSRSIQSDNVCNSKACIATASLLSNTVNKEVDPCHDFYQFSCGKFIGSEKITRGYTKIAPYYKKINEMNEKLKKSLLEITKDDSKTFEKLKSYYRICLEKEKKSERELLEIFESFGGWPLITGSSWKDSSFDLSKAIYQFEKLSNINFSRINVKKDVGNKVMIWVDRDGVNNKYLSQILASNKTNDYITLMIDTAKAFGANKNDVTQEAKKVFDFETKLSKISISIPRRYRTMNLNELQRQFPAINWFDYLSKVLYPQYELKSSDEVLLYDFEYFENYFKLLSETPKTVQANYVCWSFFMSIDPEFSLLSSRLKNIKYDFLHKLRGERYYIKSSKCIFKILKDMGLAKNIFYVKKHFDRERKTQMLELMTEVKSSLRKILNDTLWLDSETKKQSLERLERIQPYFSYSDELLNDTALDDYYKNLEIDPSNDFLTGLSIEQSKNKINSIDDLSFKVNLHDEINGYFINNSLLITLALLEVHSFGRDVPNYMNYGLMGYIVGHEISHAYDNIDALFSKSRSNRKNWNSNAENEFSRRSQCIVSQYSNYTLKHTKVSLDGVKTSRENNADNIGLKAAYHAYQARRMKNWDEAYLPGFEEYTPNQMFWISFAQNFCEKTLPYYQKETIKTNTHSTNEFRVIGSVSNRPEFARDFKCKLGTRMNPLRKCTLYRK